MPTTKSGEKISWKEFFVRWKKGIDNITPDQRINFEYNGSIVTLLGLIVSLVAVIIFREKIGLLAYGLILIFVGNIVTTASRTNALRQQKNLFKTMKETIKEDNVNGI